MGWKGTQSTAQACQNLLRSKAECNPRFFAWAYGGDKNCGCLTQKDRDCFKPSNRNPFGQERVGVYAMSGVKPPTDCVGRVFAALCHKCSRGALRHDRNCFYKCRKSKAKQISKLTAERC